jgi:cell division protein FtsZ
LVNLDFADIRSVMREMGKAMMGTGEATGENRATEAAEAAISNPLLDDVSLKGAKALLINVTGGMDMTLFEVDEAANRIRDEVDPDANIIFGSTFYEQMEGSMRVSVVATGIDMEEQRGNRGMPKEQEVKRHPFGMTARPEKPRIMQSGGDPRESARSIAEQRSSVLSRHDGAEEALEQEMPAAPAAPFSVASNEPKLEGGDIPAFSSVKPAKPEQEPRYVDSEGDLFSEVPEENIRENHEQPQAMHGNQPPASVNFLQRLAGVGKSIAAGARHEHEEEVYEEPKPRAQVKEKSATEEQEEDYLEIPAFLRRQAN